MPAFAKSQVAISVDPTSKVGRRPMRSTQSRAGMVITTLITYWMELDTRSVSPVKPAMVKTYVMSDKARSARSLIDSSDCSGAASTRAIHHNVHSRKLTPNLREQADMRAIDIPRTQELQVTSLPTLPLDLDPLLNLLQLACNPWALGIATHVNEDQYLLAFFPSIF